MQYQWTVRYLTVKWNVSLHNCQPFLKLSKYISFFGHKFKSFQVTSTKSNVTYNLLICLFVPYSEKWTDILGSCAKNEVNLRTDTL